MIIVHNQIPIEPKVCDGNKTPGSNELKASSHTMEIIDDDL